jgi:hypothetical protein
MSGVEQIYSEAAAEVLMALAMRGGQCAELMNELAAGSAVTMDASTTPPRLAFISAAQVEYLASGGERGTP